MPQKQTQPTAAGLEGDRLKGPVLRRRQFIDIGRLRPFFAVDDLELDVVTFLEALIAFAGDSGIMNEHIGAVFAADESVPLGVVKPLDLTLDSGHELFLSYCRHASTTRRNGAALAH